MKAKILTLIMMLLSVGGIYAAEKVTDVFTLDHQMSAHCEKKITENLRFEKGVKDLKVSLKENVITITYDPDKTGTEQILKAFKKIGFNAMQVRDEDEESSSDSAVTE